MRLPSIRTLTLVLIAAQAAFVGARASTIDFDDLPLGTAISTQYDCVTFSTKLASGGSGPLPVIYNPANGTTSERQALSTVGSGGSSREWLVMTFDTLQRQVTFTVGVRFGFTNSVRVTAYDGSGAVVQVKNPWVSNNPVNTVAGFVKMGSLFGPANIRRIEVIANDPNMVDFEMIDDLTYTKDSTKGVAKITSPSGLACICDTVTVVGSAYDRDCGGVASWVLQYAPFGPDTPDESEWITINAGTVEVINSVLGVWNTAGLPGGYYWLRLVVTNSEGAETVAITLVMVDKQFDTLNVTSPAPNQVVGGSVCVGGTVWDYCFNAYTVEYAPSGSSAFLPVDPANPVYGSTVINRTFAVWDTASGPAAAPDGLYVIKTYAKDICSYTAEDQRRVIVDNTAPQAVITEPINCAVVNGVVPVKGVAFDDNIASWALQYTGGNVNGWVTIASGSTNINGLLANWNTAGLMPCAYTLRLVVTDKAVIDCNPVIHHTSEFYVSVIVGIVGDVDFSGCVDDADLTQVILHFGEGCP